MSIAFSEIKWQEIKKNTAKWWSGELGRPLIQVRLKGRNPGREKPEYPCHDFASFYDFDIPAEKIVDAWDYDLCCTEFLGDAFPHIFPNFGPGSIAAYMGAKLENGHDTVWFHPDEFLEIANIKFQLISTNKWFLRTREVINKAVKRWNNMVQIGLTDIGGNMDILSVFRPSEQLLFDLYDNPKEVKRLIREAHEVWWECFEIFNEITGQYSPGYSHWARIFSEEPHYILQCDFCYMISPDMFEEFVKPELKATAGKLSKVFYHLDGPGQLAHLDSLIAMDEIHGIQWVPGAGQPDITQWGDVYKKITNAGKLIHITSGMADDPYTAMDRIVDQTGTADNIVYHFDAGISERDKVEKLLDRYGI